MSFYENLDKITKVRLSQKSIICLQEVQKMFSREIKVRAKEADFANSVDSRII